MASELKVPFSSVQVLSEKRRKLHETWHRVIKMYERESPEQYVDLKKLWHSYQNRKREVVAQYEAVKNAQNVTVDSIPLPSGDMSGTGDFERRSPISFSLSGHKLR